MEGRKRRTNRGEEELEGGTHEENGAGRGKEHEGHVTRLHPCNKSMRHTRGDREAGRRTCKGNDDAMWLSNKGGKIHHVWPTAEAAGVVLEVSNGMGAGCQRSLFSGTAEVRAAT